MIRAAIFDWGGTLTPWHDIDPVEQWLAATGDEQHAQRLHDAAGEIWARSRDQHRSATLEEVFALAGIEHTETMVTAFYDWWEPHTYTDPEAAELFRALHARDICVGVLSNTIWSREQHQRIFDRDGLSELIDAAVYSSELAWTKPHPEAFNAALAAVGGPAPHEAVFVGDRPFDDIHGASAVGMRTVLVPHSNIPADQVPDHGSGPVVGTPDAVAHRLGEVLEIIDRWADRA